MSARRRVLHLIPDLDYGGAARQLSLLAPGLAMEGHEQHVAVLRDDGPLSQPLRNAGINPAFLSCRRRRLIDPDGWFRLRGLLRTVQPEVIHVWGRPALRFLCFVGGWPAARLVASLCGRPRKRLGLADRFDELLL